MDHEDKHPSDLCIERTGTFCMEGSEVEYCGHTPKGINMSKGYGSGEMRFTLCCNCGQVQGKFPISDEQLKTLSDMDY